LVSQCFLTLCSSIYRCGGARICYIFHETFGRVLESIDPLGDLTQLDILTAIRNATGPRPTLFVPETSFELLVKRQIRRLEEPSLRCVELVHEELQRIVQHCGLHTQQEMQRFPRLYDKINEVVSSVLKSRLRPTNEIVENLVAIELAYINTKHPEFTDASLVSILKQEMQRFPRLYDKINEVVSSVLKSRLRPTNEIVENLVAIELAYINTKHPEFTDASLVSILKEQILFDEESKRAHKIGNPIPNSTTAANVVEATSMTIGASGDTALTQSTSEGTGLSGWIFRSSSSASTKQSPSSPRKSVNFLPEVPEKTITRKLTPREQRDCQIIERLIRCYFMIVRKNVQDAVPKAIMCFLVNYVRDNLQSELVRQLYKHEMIEELLSENPTMAQRRKETAEMLDALNKASQIIGEIRETQIW
uniref:GED domain-containing protein n=1 Tax=Ascaris lumbricoides TaxID=6252 RepID=A0A0M3IIS9_ASCLU